MWGTGGRGRGGTVQAGEARWCPVPLLPHTLCWAFGFWLTLYCWVKSQSSGFKSLSFFFFWTFGFWLLAFALVSVACGPSSHSVRHTCPQGVHDGLSPPPSGRDVVGGSDFSPHCPLFFILSGFSVSTAGRMHIFKPVSVQAMW